MVSVSHTVYVTVPKISLSITKEGSGYFGTVTCWSSQGTLPVNFSLLLDNIEEGFITATKSLVASFPIPILPGQDMGVARCRVANEVQELTSEPLSLLIGRNCSHVCLHTEATVCLYVGLVFCFLSACTFLGQSDLTLLIF